MIILSPICFPNKQGIAFPICTRISFLEPVKIKLSGNIIKGQLSKIIATPAKFQSAKGLVTAGLVKSARYAYAKLKKGALKGIV